MSAKRSTFCENSRALHISPHNSGTVIDSDKSSINANRQFTMGFPSSHQPSSCVRPNFHKLGFRYPKFVVCRRNFDKKPLKVCYKLSLSKNFQQQSCSGINYLSNGINILAGDEPFPVKFGPKGTDPNGKDARFTFHTWRAVQSAIADLLVFCSDTPFAFQLPHNDVPTVSATRICMRCNINTFNSMGRIVSR